MSDAKFSFATDLSDAFDRYKGNDRTKPHNRNFVSKLHNIVAVSTYEKTTCAAALTRSGCLTVFASWKAFTKSVIALPVTTQVISTQWLTTNG
jgi:hypothetical protein